MILRRDKLRFGYRDYDPACGRFTCPDPLGDTGGDHDLYDYCVDDPVSMVDRSGLKTSETDWLNMLDDSTDFVPMIRNIKQVKDNGWTFAQAGFGVAAFLADVVNTFATREFSRSVEDMFKGEMSTDVRDGFKRDFEKIKPKAEAIIDLTALNPKGFINEFKK